MMPGAGQPVATQATRYNGMQVQGSQYGLGLTIVYGQQRIPGNLIWYGDFQSVEHKQSVGKGGGGVSTSYTYSSSFQLALCEGPVAGLVTIWKDSGTTSLSDINGTFSAGSATQPAWSHLSGADALQYPDTAWVGCINLALGSSPNVPNFNFEIAGLFQYAPTASPPIIDADPSAIFADLLTSTTHGLGFQYLGDLSLYHDYCVANGIFLSLKVDQQTTMNEILTRFLQITNSNTAWSEGKLTVIPYGDETVTGNGVTYTPATTVQKYFQDSDYIKPVQVTRKPLSDLYNVIRVEYVNRANNYNTSVAEAKDQADIDTTFSVRQQEIIQGHAITNGTLAQWIAQTILQRALYIRNTYTFTTTMENVAFEPGDVIALSDSQAELVNEPVRIKSISEQGTNELQFVCEEFPAGVAVGATQTVEPPAGYVPSVNGAPDTTQPAVIFRGPQFLTDGVPEVWIGVGGSGTNWGGANILVSLDNVSYTKIGTVSPGCRYGTLTAALATSSTDPDTTNSFSVALDAGGTLSGGTDAEADNLSTLMLIDTELVAYSSTTLNSDGTYTLGNGYLRRGCYETGIAAHAIGAPWIRVDESVFRWQVDPSLVGTTVYIKIQPWNLYGGGLVSESSLTAITYVIGTAEEVPDTPPTPTNLSATGAANGNLITWDVPNPAAVAITSVEVSTDNATWSVLGQVQGTHYVHAFSGPATYYYRVRSRSWAFIWSAYTTSVQSTGGSLDSVVDGATFVRLLGSRAAGNVAYNFRGLWSSTTAYLKGDEVVEGQTYWVATAPNTNSQPSTSNGNWQSVGSYSAYQGAWSSTPAYVAGAEVTYGGNYWICVTANTNSAPSTTNANWVMAGPQTLDNVGDGTTYARLPLGYFNNLTSRYINLNYTVDGPSRFAVVNGNGLGGVSYWDANNNPRVDFTGTYHIGKVLDNIPDGTTRFAVKNGSMYGVSYIDPNSRALIDFTQSGHVGKSLANIPDDSSTGRNAILTPQRAALLTNKAGDNLYLDPTFSQPSLWYSDYAGSANIAFLPPTVSVSAGVNLYNNVRPMDGSGTTQRIAVRPGDQFYSEITVQSSSGTCEGQVWVDWNEASGTGISSISGNATAGGGVSSMTVTAPASAAFAQFHFAALGGASGGNVVFTQPLVSRLRMLDTEVADGATYSRFLGSYMDSTRRVSNIAGGVSPLGSIATGASTVTFSYSSTDAAVTISWTAGTLYRMDGTQTSVGSGSVSVSSLSASTTYYAAAYYDETTAAVDFVTGETGATGSPAILYTSESAVVAWQASLQAHIDFGWLQVATGASGSTGGGGGGGACCLRGRQLIELHNGVLREAHDLATGDILTSPDGPIRIKHLAMVPWDEWYTVGFNDGRVLEVAPNHRFIEPGGLQIRAHDLKLHQVVQARDGYVSVTRLEVTRERDLKVSIEVQAPHVYYVDGILSHNKYVCT